MHPYACSSPCPPMPVPALLPTLVNLTHQMLMALWNRTPTQASNYLLCSAIGTELRECGGRFHPDVLVALIRKQVRDILDHNCCWRE